ncbi:helix-turn-helix domain-containing protein [Flavobacterium sp.]|uniref:helix-turn-helix domain-containing protein n=1 Tax=Flavobacterium sp. TaxID=239 RepID=UPI00374DF61D
MNNVKDIGYIKLFGENLQKIRMSRKMSQETLAYDSDIPISQVGRIERGEINTTISTVKALSKALNISVKDLFDFE